MSIARDMIDCMLQEKVTVRSKSGAKIDEWRNVHQIKVAIYKSDERIIAASEKYKDATHVGLTFCKNIKSGKHQLVIDGAVYQVKKSDSKHRLTNLILKEVDTDV